MKDLFSDTAASSSWWEQLWNSIADWFIDYMPGALGILLGGWLVMWMWRLVSPRVKRLLELREASDTLDRAETDKRAKTLYGILNSVVRITLLLIVVLVLLSHFGVSIGPMLASVGILGLAIGFGAQELVKDFITGFFILLENHVRAGDVVVLNGTGGLVEKVGLRTTILRDLSGVVHVFRNGAINTLSNMTKEWSAMVFDIGVAYKENTDAVAEIIKSVGEELRQDEYFGAKILDPIECFGLDAFGDSAVVLKARIKTQPAAQWEVGREYRRRLKMAFDKAGVEIPFPHQTIYWGEDIKPLQVNQGK